MKVKIHPSKAAGSVKIPPSKSMGHRAIICACLAGGTSRLTNVAFSDDIKATIAGMQQLEATIVQDGESLTITGIKGFSNFDGREVNCLESGSTLRFFVPIFSLCGKEVKFLGQNRLFKRPQKIYKDIFLDQGLLFKQTEKDLTIKGALKSGLYEIDGSVSSQFISGLMFTLPLLDGDSVIKITPPFESASYVKLTVEMLERYGIAVEFLDELTIKIKGNQNYTPADYEIEGDYSQLGFMAVLGAVNSDVTCTGMNTASNQGDKAVIDILNACGVMVDNLSDGFTVHAGAINATEIDLADCPDLGPILTVLAMYGKGDFRIYNAGRLKIKESDRGVAMQTELRKLGVQISCTDDEILITGGSNYSATEELYGHKDHRIVMSLAIAATMLQAPAVIDGAEAVSKSYPDFFQDLEKLNIEVEYL